MDGGSARRKAFASSWRHNTEMRSNSRALIGTGIHGPSIEAVKTHNLDRAAAVIGPTCVISLNYWTDSA
jgi:hypothetical protein